MAQKKRIAKKSKKRVPKKGSAKKPAAVSLDALARKIVRMTQQPAFAPANLRVLYADDCTSQEGTGQIDRGIAGLEDKLKRWDQMQSGTTWKAFRLNHRLGEGLGSEPLRSRSGRVACATSLFGPEYCGVNG